MTTLGQLCLLIAFVGSGYSAFACLVGWYNGQRAIRVGGLWSALAAAFALTAAMTLLSCALLTRDLRFEYVTEYCSKVLPWHYCLSALWVGQAGSLLVWAWFLAVVAMGFRFLPGQRAGALREPAFGILMGYLCFLVSVMVFSADPMEPSLVASEHGTGLSPLLQHPAMLVHPPIVFLGYAAWGVPFALAVAALVTGQLDGAWVKAARGWTLFAWAVLGGGILLGAEWAYEELGWGGYWSWDPVENGSLIPWLTGTALIHCMLSWTHAGVLKKSALLLAIATCGLCNFATFLTRSGIFSSLHDFGQSTIGWMFLVAMCVLAVGGGFLVALRRGALVAQRPIGSLWSREAMMLVSTVAIVLLAAVTLVGTLMQPLSGMFSGTRITVGPAFYNNVLIPVGLELLAVSAVAPLLRWGGAPAAFQKKMLLASAAAAGLTAAVACAFGLRHPVAVLVAGLSGLALVAPLAAMVSVVSRRERGEPRIGLLDRLASRRRQYAAVLIHVGVALLAIGVTGSSLGTVRHEVTVTKGETISWAGRSVRYVDLIQRELPGKLVIESQLEVSRQGDTPYTLLPAQYFHRSENAWSSRVAIHSDWSGDFYTILDGGEVNGKVGLTFIVNPLMRWLWVAGWISVVGAVVGLWPGRRRSAVPASGRVVSRAALGGPHRPRARNPEDAIHD